uniref:Protein kinase domain-containing protein n=1 Tax=Panagrellus redivivus TaxID=6233 RepID=A0A7E4VDI2_PANRE
MLCLAVGTARGKVELKNEQIERVSFEGEELIILGDNSLGKKDYFTICFPSSTDSHPYCPSGFAGAAVLFKGNEKRELILNRKGKLLVDGVNLGLTGTVKFNEDGTLNVTVTGLSESRLTVTLLNAKIYEPEKLEEEKNVKKESSNAVTIGIVLGVVGLILFVIGVVAAVAICLYRRKKSQNQPIMPPEIVVQSVPDVTKTPVGTPETNQKKEMPPTPKAAPEPTPPQTPVKTPPTPNATPAESKPKTPPATVIPTPPADAAGLQPTSPSTDHVEQPPKKNHVKMVESKGKAKAPLAESTEQTKEASVDQPAKPNSKVDSKKSLKVEMTQSATVPSPPSLKFSDHPYSKAVSKASVLKEKDNLKYEETANPFTKKMDYSKVDRLTRLQLLTESIRCYGMRNGKFTRHDNFIIRERFSTKKIKATPSEAVKAADALMDRIERELKTFGFRPEDDLTQNPVLWGHLNYEEAEMSKFYWLLIRQRPDLFKVEKEDVNSEEVREMPIAMLYALILNTKLTRRFREELVIELRKATVDVIRLTGQDALRFAAFPLNYLVLLHNKNPSSYVEGRSGRSTGYRRP